MSALATEKLLSDDTFEEGLKERGKWDVYSRHARRMPDPIGFRENVREEMIYKDLGFKKQQVRSGQAQAFMAKKLNLPEDYTPEVYRQGLHSFVKSRAQDERDQQEVFRNTLDEMFNPDAPARVYLEPKKKGFQELSRAALSRLSATQKLFLSNLSAVAKDNTVFFTASGQDREDGSLPPLHALQEAWATMTPAEQAQVQRFAPMIVGTALERHPQQERGFLRGADQAARNFIEGLGTLVFSRGRDIRNAGGNTRGDEGVVRVVSSEQAENEKRLYGALRQFRGQFEGKVREEGFDAGAVGEFLGSSLVEMAAAGAGLPLLMASRAGSFEADDFAENPQATNVSRMIRGSLSGFSEGALARLQLKVLKVEGKTIGKLVGDNAARKMLGRYGAKFGAGMLTEGVAEGLQEFSPDIVNAVASKLDPNVQRPDFGAKMEAIRRDLPEIGTAFALMVGVSSGLELTAEIRNSRVLGWQTESAEILQMMNLEEDVAQEIAAIEDPVDRVNAFAEASAKRRKEVEKGRAEPSPVITPEIAAGARKAILEEMEVEAEGSTVPIFIPLPDGTIDVQTPDGGAVNVDSPEAAFAAASNWSQQAAEGRRDALQAVLKGLGETELSRLQEVHPELQAEETGSRSLSGAVVGGEITPERATRRIRDLAFQRAAQDESIGDPEEYADALVSSFFEGRKDFEIEGEALGDARIEGGVLIAGIRLSRSRKSLLNVWQETAEAHAHAMLNGGFLEERELEGYLRRLEEQTGKKFLSGTSREQLIEGFSFVVQGYAAGDIKPESFSGKLRNLIDDLIAAFLDLVGLAREIQAVRERGELNPELEANIQAALGQDGGRLYRNLTAEAEIEIDPDLTTLDNRGAPPSTQSIAENQIAGEGGFPPHVPSRITTRLHEDEDLQQELDFSGEELPDAGGRSYRTEDSEQSRDRTDPEVRAKVLARYLKKEASAAELARDLQKALERGRVSLTLHDLAPRETPSFDVRGLYARTPGEFAALNAALRNPYYESFRVAILDDSNKVVHSQVLHVGALTETVAHPRNIIQALDYANAGGEYKHRRVLVSHNHPSGSPSPSRADREFTKRLASALESVDAELLDHVITNGTDYFSFMQATLLNSTESYSGVDPESHLYVPDWDRVMPRETRPKFDSPKEAWNTIRPLRALNPDGVYAAYLSARLQVLAVEQLPYKPGPGVPSRQYDAMIELLHRGAAAEGAYTVLVSLPKMPLGQSRHIATMLRNKIDPSVVELSDVISSAASADAPYTSFKELGTLSISEGNRKSNFYSSLEKAIESRIPNRATPQQIRATLDPAKGTGAKKAEMDWIGLEEWLSDPPLVEGMVRKIDLLEFVRRNTPEVTESAPANQRWMLQDWDGTRYFETEEEADAERERLLQEADERYLVDEDELEVWDNEYSEAVVEMREEGEDENGNPIYVMGPIVAENSDWAGTIWTEDERAEMIGALEEVRENLVRSMQEDVPEVEEEDGDELYEEQTQEGGDNYRVLLLHTPHRGEAPYESSKGHFGHYGNVAVWLRLKDRAGPGGKKALHIEEIQSDWVTDLRSAGPGMTENERERLEDELIELESEAEAERGSIIRFFERENIPYHDWVGRPPQVNWREVSNRVLGRGSQLLSSDELDGERARIEELLVSDEYQSLTYKYRRAFALRELLNNARQRPPDMPFTGNYFELAFKRALQLAAEERYDLLTWTTGKDQIELYNDRLRQNVARIRWENLGDGQVLIKAWTPDEEAERASRAAVGESENTPKFNEKVPLQGKGTVLNREASLEDVVGGGIAKEIREGKRSKGEREGKDLSIGGHFHKLLYDQMLPKFAKKFGKKWGMKPAMIEVGGERSIGSETVEKLERAGNFVAAELVTELMEHRETGSINPLNRIARERVEASAELSAIRGTMMEVVEPSPAGIPNIMDVPNILERWADTNIESQMAALESQIPDADGPEAKARLNKERAELQRMKAFGKEHAAAARQYLNRYRMLEAQAEMLENLIEEPLVAHGVEVAPDAAKAAKQGFSTFSIEERDWNSRSNEFATQYWKRYGYGGTVELTVPHKGTAVNVDFIQSNSRIRGEAILRDVRGRFPFYTIHVRGAIESALGFYAKMKVRGVIDSYSQEDTINTYGLGDGKDLLEHVVDYLVAMPVAEGEEVYMKMIRNLEAIRDRNAARTLKATFAKTSVLKVPVDIADALIRGEVGGWTDEQGREFSPTPAQLRELERIAGEDPGNKKFFTVRTFQNVDPDENFAMLQDLAMYDGILRALPRDVRGRMGGFVTLAKLPTHESRLKFLEEHLEQVQKHLDKYLGDKFREEIEELLLLRKLENKGGVKRGKGAEFQARLDEIHALTELDRDEVRKRQGELESALGNTEDPDRIASLSSKLMDLIVFGNVFLKGSNRRSAPDLMNARDELARVVEKGLTKWEMLEAARKAGDASNVEDLVREITNEEGLENPSEAKRKRPGKVKDFLQEVANKSNSWEWILNRAMAGARSLATQNPVGKRWAMEAHLATHKERRRNWKESEEKARALAGIFGIATKGNWRFRLSRRLEEQMEEVETGVSKLEFQSSKETIRIPVDKAQGILDGSLNPETFGLLEADRRALRNLVEEATNRRRPRKWVELEKRTEGEKSELFMSQDQALYISMLWDQEGNRNPMMHWGWDEATIRDLRENFLTEETHAIGNWLRWKYASGWKEINPTFSKLFGVNMPKIPFYTPGRWIHQGKMEDQDMMLEEVTPGASVTPGFAKNRVNHLAQPREDVGALQVYGEHLRQVSHFLAWAPTIRTMRAAFLNKETQAALDQRGGRWLKKAVNNRIQWFADGGNRIESMRMVDALRKRFTVIALAYNWGVFLKQLTSIPAIAFDMGLKEFAVYSARFWTDPVKHWKEIAELDFVKERFQQGFDRDVQLVLSSYSSKNRGAILAALEFGMITGRAGDIVPVVVGGWARYKSVYDKEIKSKSSEPIARRTAELEMEMTIERAQQAGDTKDLSSYQQGGSAARLFTMFLTSPLQYYMNTWNAVHNLDAPGGKQDLIKRIAVSHILLPFFFQFVSDLVRNVRNLSDDDEETGLLDLNPLDYLRAMLLGPFNGLFIVGHGLSTISGYAINTLVDIVNGEDGDTLEKVSVFGYRSPVIELLEDSGYAIKDAGKATTELLEDPSLDDVGGIIHGIAGALKPTAIGGLYDVGYRNMRSVGLDDEIATSLKPKDEQAVEYLKRQKTKIYNLDKERLAELRKIGSKSRSFEQQEEYERLNEARYEALAEIAIGELKNFSQDEINEIMEELPKNFLPSDVEAKVFPEINYLPQEP